MHGAKIKKITNKQIQAIRIIRFCFENRLHWQFELDKNAAKSCFMLHVHLRDNRILIHNSLYASEFWGGEI